MKTERENYLKPQTIMEQVAMEQGICSASIFEPNSERATIESAPQSYVGFDNVNDESKKTAGGNFVVEWD
ncbi:MAG: hypothetical protein IKY73_02735 [Bacteroidaceae bacterium]|nr:hypothetical protein [Bacteroidaceae bacterium]